MLRIRLYLLLNMPANDASSSGTTNHPRTLNLFQRIGLQEVAETDHENDRSGQE